MTSLAAALAGALSGHNLLRTDIRIGQIAIWVADEANNGQTEPVNTQPTGSSFVVFGQTQNESMAGDAISDNYGNTYVQKDALNLIDSNSTCVWVCENGNGGPGHRVFYNSIDSPGLIFVEMIGVDTYDGLVKQAVSSTTAPFLSPSYSAVADELVVAFVGAHGSASTECHFFAEYPAQLLTTVAEGFWQPMAAAGGLVAEAGAITAQFGNTQDAPDTNPHVWLVGMSKAGPTPMSLTGTLPNGTVGVAYSANLTLGGTYTTPVTMDVSSGTLPAWMTVTVTGSTVNYAGTPTTAETETFTPRATDSSTPTAQVATDPQSVVIGAAGTAPTVVQSVANGTGSGSGYTLSLPSAPTAGNLLVLTLAIGGSAPTITPSFSTPIASDTTTAAALQVYTRVSDGTETSVSVSNPGSYWVSGTLTEVHGQNATTPINAISSAVKASPSGPYVASYGPVSSTVGNVLALACCNFSSSVNSFTPSTGWTNVNGTTLINNAGNIMVAKQSSTSATSFSGSFTVNTNSGSAVNVCTFVVVIQ